MISREKQEEAKKRVMEARRIFVAVSPRPWLDAAAAAEVLARRLKAMGKEVLVSRAELAPGVKRLPFRMLRETPIPNRDLVISVDTAPADVGELRYEKENGILKIFLTPKGDPIFPDAVRVEPAGFRADLVIMAGVERLDDLGTVYQKNPQLFFEAAVLALTTAGERESEGDLTLSDPEAETLSELAVQFLKNLSGDALSPEEATVILAGVLSEMTALTDSELSPGSLKLASECLEQGADRSAVLSVIQAPTGEARLHLLGRSIVRSRRVSRNVTLALITEADFAASKTSPAEATELLMLWERHLETPFLLLLWQDPRTKTVSGLLRGKDDRLAKRLPRRTFGELRRGVMFIRDSYPTFRDAEEALLSLFEEPDERRV